MPGSRFAIVAAVLYTLLFADCMLDRSGLAPSVPVDVEFEGCFQVAAEATRRIVLLPHGVAALSGTARGLLLSGGWSFNGAVTGPGSGDLNATTELGDEFSVRATRSGVRPGDTLDLQVTSMSSRIRFEATSVTGLVRCAP